MKHRKFYPLSLLVLSLTLVSCTRQNNEAKLVIQLPPAGVLSSSKVLSSTSTDESGWAGEITTSSQINCYFVAVGGSTAERSKNTCYEKDSGTVLFKFGDYVGGVPAGSKIELSIPSGGSGTVTLAAMQAANGSCVSFKNDGPSDGQISYPRLIGTQTVNFVPGNVEVSFSIPADLTTFKQVDECDVNDGIGGGNGGENPFGSGRDGSISVSGTTEYLDFNSDNIGMISHTPAAGGVGPTKMASTSRRVVNIDTSAGRILTLDSSFTSVDFEPGDLVLWHIGMGWGSGGEDGCGGDLYRGRWDVSRVTAADGVAQTISLERSVSQTPASINNSNLAVASAVNGVAHCSMQVQRVPEFETITVASGKTLVLTNIGYTAATSRIGGVIAVQVKNLIVDGTLNIFSNGNGLPGGTVGSFSLAGAGGNTVNNENGGVYNTSGFVGGGGGGQAGRGGDLYDTPGTGGNALGYCMGASVCSPFKDKKMFFGGGGGGDSSNAGANGGGIVILMAKDVSGSGTIDLRSTGAIPGAGNTGGGAGGSVVFVNRSLASGITLNTDVRGGNGSGDGGGGGGGTIEIAKCNTLFSGVLSAPVYSAGTSVATNTEVDADAGQIFNYDLSLTRPGLCL